MARGLASSLVVCSILFRQSVGTCSGLVNDERTFSDLVNDEPKSCAARVLMQSGHGKGQMLQHSRTLPNCGWTVFYDVWVPTFDKNEFDHEDYAVYKSHDECLEACCKDPKCLGLQLLSTETAQCYKYRRQPTVPASAGRLLGDGTWLRVKKSAWSIYMKELPMLAAMVPAEGTQEANRSVWRDLQRLCSDLQVKFGPCLCLCMMCALIVVFVHSLTSSGDSVARASGQLTGGCPTRWRGKAGEASRLLTDGKSDCTREMVAIH